MSAASRGRRPLFGEPSSSTSAANLDPESLERENDKTVDHLGDKASLLKNMTTGIRDEVEMHNKLLERMQANMATTSGMLSNSVDRFKNVLKSPERRKMVFLVSSFILLFFCLYWVATRGA